MGVFLGTVARIDEVSSNYLYKIEEDLKTRLYSTKFSKEPKFQYYSQRHMWGPHTTKT